MPMKPVSARPWHFIKDNKMGTERERHESMMGGWRQERACVTRHMAYVRRQMFLCGGER